ncbi:uncharacterized protein BJ171DRAFT_67596 [Polychytrium aggregatum]|uniref:uncharacterized protein n=1 Tax=Polychytrium aggregatum TaxID=110093 RepID=UPI0022FE5D8C|nr:uncharacterized protein BJ171DRAFT_67596 [Polychytrium aggregatum]KAI9190698.1 hypothetical protein BJ171DRAFT_67596 [Polychytrium aggregatum]
MAGSALGEERISSKPAHFGLAEMLTLASLIQIQKRIARSISRGKTSCQGESCLIAKRSCHLADTQPRLTRFPTREIQMVVALVRNRSGASNNDTIGHSSASIAHHHRQLAQDDTKCRQPTMAGFQLLLHLGLQRVFIFEMSNREQPEKIDCDKLPVRITRVCMHSCIHVFGTDKAAPPRPMLNTAAMELQCIRISDSVIDSCMIWNHTESRVV